MGHTGIRLLGCSFSGGVCSWFGRGICGSFWYASVWIVFVRWLRRDLPSVDLLLVHNTNARKTWVLLVLCFGAVPCNMVARSTIFHQPAHLLHRTHLLVHMYIIGAPLIRTRWCDPLLSVIRSLAH